MPNLFRIIPLLLAVGYAFMCSLLAGPSAALADEFRTFTNSEFGFGFQYPASWQVRPPGSPNSKGKVVSPDGSPSAECAVIVQHYAQLSTLSQIQIDQAYSQPTTPSQLGDVLSQGFNDVTVMAVAVGALHSRPAHFARVRYSVGTAFGKTYVSGRVVMTATPGLTWTINCGGNGRTLEEAEASYLRWQSAINSIVVSFRFK